MLVDIHTYIDNYFNPRYIGVTDEDRFMILFKIKLLEIENNFFNSFKLDTNYDDIIDMLKNIDMLSDTETDTDLHGTNTSTIDTTRTDNLTQTKSSRDDKREDVASSVQNIGNTATTKETTNGGTITEDKTYGKKDTQGGTTTTDTEGSDSNKTRAVNSQVPQSNIGSNIVGIDANLDWNYASAMHDTKANNTNQSEQTVKHGLTNTTSGTDSTTTEDKRTSTDTITTIPQENHVANTGTSNFTEGEQSVTNTGSQDTTTTEDRSHQQIGKYNKINNNSGRNDNLAIIRQQWRDLLHTTITAYMYLFNNLEPLFYNLWG